MKSTVVALLVAGLAVSACATSAGRIQPITVSPVVYQDQSCDQLAVTAAKVDADLQVASIKQNKKRKGDTVSVILIGLPLASMGGNGYEADVARLKGEKIALAEAKRLKSCPA